jgi:sirohydrochlorin ferrochelatase
MRAALLALSITLGNTTAQAQTGLVVVAHGATPEWNAKVRETVAQVRWPHGAVAVAFLMGPEAATAGWDAAIDTLRARGAAALVVVPLMVSTHGFHYDQTEYYAGLRDTLIMPPARPPRPGADTAARAGGGHDHHVHHRPPGLPAVVTPAIDAAPELSAILMAQWAALAAECRRRPVMLVAHGPNNDAQANRWVTNLSIAAQGLAAAGFTGPVRVGLLRDDAPPSVRAAAVGAIRDTIQALARRAADSVVVLPVLISSGGINRVTIPRDLKDLPIRYHPVALASHLELARWIERVAGAAQSAIN